MSSSGFDGLRRSLFADPMQAVAALIAAVMTTVMLNQLSVWFAPLLFIGSIVGMVAVTRARIKAEHVRKLGEQSVSYERLAAIDPMPLKVWIKESLRGHDATVDAIFQNVDKRLQLAQPGRTLGNFLLVGPTGTGKTFLSQLVAQGLYPKSEEVRLNLNTCKQPGDVAMLIGPPPGAPGYEIGGRMTRPVLDNPYRVIILDELEKCHHDLHDCLYDILDTASCREKSSGRLVDFSASVIFGTCNAGVEALRKLMSEIGSTTSSAWLGRSRDALADAAGFDRAFLSRWDGIYLMDQLAQIHVAEVACLELVQYWRKYGIEVEYADPELIFNAVQRNHDFAAYGVRQLGRFIREQTEGAILQAKRKGAKRVALRVNADSGELDVEVPA